MARDILYDMAAVDLATSAADSPHEFPPDADEFPVASLPIDPEPWFGGAVITRVELMDGRTKNGPFYYWVSRGSLLGMQPVLDPQGGTEAAYALWVAMLTPADGEPRRPRRVIVANEHIVAALRSEGYKDLEAVLEIEIGSTAETDPVAETALAEARPRPRKRR